MYRPDEAVCRLVCSVDDSQGEAKAAFGGGDYRLDIPGLPQGGGADGVDGFDAIPPGYQGKVLQGFQRAADANLVKHPIGVHVAHQVQVHPLLGDDLNAAAGVHLHHHRPGRTGTDVDDSSVLTAFRALPITGNLGGQSIGDAGRVSGPGYCHYVLT